jgi:hypothetical protein
MSRAVAGQDSSFKLHARREGKECLDWQAHLGDQLQAVSDTGNILKVRFFNTTQRDVWLRNYRRKLAEQR